MCGPRELGPRDEGFASRGPGVAATCRRCGLPAHPGLGLQRAREPREYTPRHLAEKILSFRSALEGERKLVTVLFVDIKGSMELADEIGAELLHEVMDRFFAILSEGIHLFQGTINQFTGDGVMALFGAPIAHEDHARRACYAALHLNEDMRRYSAQLERDRGIGLGVRMGINSGEVVVGSIGDDLRMDYTAQGHTVGLAARIEQLTPPGSVYLSESTARLVDGFFRLRDQGEFEIKGLREPARIWELCGIGPLRTRLDRSYSRGLTTFVGRDAEMELLEDALERSLAGDTQIVGVIAAAGVGKSRLCLEFGQRCQERGTPVRVSHALAHGQLTPFLPVLQLLRTVFGIHDSEDEASVRKKITSTTLLLAPDLEEGLPLLFEFLGVPDPDFGPLALDPDTSQDRLLQIITRLLRAHHQQERGVFLLEDLHWLDSSSELFLEKFVESIVGTPTLLLVNFRPGYHAPWMSKPYYHEVALRPLDEEDVAQFLGHLLGDHPSVCELSQAIHQRCDGNPFFIEEVVQSLVDSGKLEGDRETYRLTTPVEHLSVPATVHAVLDARIDQLAEIEKMVLQAAAVVGNRFSEALLCSVLPVDAGALHRALESLIELEFIYECHLYPAANYAFTHPLTQEVAYHSQLSEARSRIHGQIAQALENLHADKLDENAALLAHHWEEAGDLIRAAGWHRRAAEWLGLSNISASDRHWRFVLEVAGDAPETPDAIELALIARIWLLQLAWRLGFPEEETTELFEQGVALARRIASESSVIILELTYAVYCGVVADHDGHYRYACDATRLAEQAGHQGLTRASRLSMLTALISQGRLAEALEATKNDRVSPVELLNRSPDDEALTQEVFTLGMRGVALSLAGRLDEAASELALTQQLADHIPAPETRGYIHAFCVEHALLTGDRGFALDHGTQAAALADETEIPLQIADGYLALGNAQVLAEQWDAALDSLGHALDVVNLRHALMAFRPRIYTALSRAHLGRGEAGQALECIEQVLDGNGATVARVVEINAQLALAQALLLARGSRAAEAIQDAIDRAIQNLERTSALAYRPAVHCILAEIAEHTNDHGARRIQLHNAHDLYRAMGAEAHARNIAAAIEHSVGPHVSTKAGVSRWAAGPA
ncbi:MAG: AAA family ATPase [Deltaproteobacteria bacterium]|nr:AAA family ATPase [Deltaproteobacteria bacterium]MBW2420435.1 AAA family ATPase [Deltaproteobacteria bacterium]